MSLTNKLPVDRLTTNRSYSASFPLLRSFSRPRDLPPWTWIHKVGFIVLLWNGVSLKGNSDAVDLLLFPKCARIGIEKSINLIDRFKAALPPKSDCIVVKKYFCDIHFYTLLKLKKNTDRGDWQRDWLVRRDCDGEPSIYHHKKVQSDADTKTIDSGSHSDEQNNRRNCCASTQREFAFQSADLSW